MSAEAAPTGSVRRRRRRFARWRPSVALASVVGALIGSQVVALAVLLAAGGDDAPDWVSALGIVFADLVLLGVIVAVAQRGAEKVGPATFGIRRTRFWGAVGWMLITYIAISIFNAIWLTLVGTGNLPRSEDPTATQVTVGGAILVAFGVAVVAPIVEEVVFRGYLFPALARWKGPWLGATVCGVVFGLAHAAVYPPQLLPLMAVFGFFACLLFWFTGSLLPCIALHACNNALVTGRDFGWSWEVPLLMLGCMAVALLLLTPFARERAPVNS